MRTLSIAGLALLAPLAHAGNVHIVGGPASTAATIQDAITAAVDGDVVLVRDAFPAGFVLDGKALTIVGEGTQPEVSSPIEIRNVPSGRTCALRNLRMSSGEPTLVDVRDCTGHVRFEELSLTGLSPATGLGATTLRVVNCADVALAHSTLLAGIAANVGQGGRAALLANASVVIDQSTLVGGHGYNGFFIGQSAVSPGPGAPAVELDGASTLSTQGTTITGGTGGQGVSGRCFPAPIAGGPGAAGGAGIAASSPLSVVLVDALVSGGDGGPGGAASASCGAPAGLDGPDGPATDQVTLNTLVGPGRVLVANALTRELATLDLVVVGVPGESATLLISAQCQHNALPSIQGPVLVGPALRRIPLGIVPGSGVLNASLPLADLAPGVQGSRRFLQAFCRDANGQVRLTGCASVVFLDAAY